MAITTCKIFGGIMATDVVNYADPRGTLRSVSKFSHHNGLHLVSQRIVFGKSKKGELIGHNVSLFCGDIWGIQRNSCKPVAPLEHTMPCLSSRTQNTETQEFCRDPEDCQDLSSAQFCGRDVEDLLNSRISEQPQSRENNSSYSSQGLAEACKYVYNDAKFVNERARNGIILLSRGIMRLDNRARQDVAILGSKFLKLDARAREDTEKIDNDVKRKAAHLHHIAKILKDKAQSKLKTVADKHWSDGALNDDLRRADFCVKRRAMEDAFISLEFVKNIHDMMVGKMYQMRKGPPLADNMMGAISLEKNGEALNLFPGEVSTDRITAIQDIYWSMASALSEADGFDYTDPDEISRPWMENIAPHFWQSVQALLMLVQEGFLGCRGQKHCLFLSHMVLNYGTLSVWQALANALASAPSMWILGNAGMGALQRLAEDSNPAVAAAATKAINELKKQWKLDEGDSWKFTLNQKLREFNNIEEDDREVDTP
ncbi:uncharacterized protein LOC18428766 isoform X2 [Amborella trichopoda]|uniref:uncharacterized protein LOC18428766 isoform X2 n=1 Tax=Amborella trichopoda TaxID=13333 RepID=UPI0009C02FBA|nr:uncharacterized protein LOC18428766 isoform X2 [Amborella trichopoda]|eukprot:XP_020519626.1 uncharacterized protein LOC18428766 isoform X2 [Amborella trichopoda]